MKTQVWVTSLIVDSGVALSFGLGETQSRIGRESRINEVHVIRRNDRELDTVCERMEDEDGTKKGDGPCKK